MSCCEALIVHLKFPRDANTPRREFSGAASIPAYLLICQPPMQLWFRIHPMPSSAIPSFSLVSSSPTVPPLADIFQGTETKINSGVVEGNGGGGVNLKNENGALPVAVVQFNPAGPAGGTSWLETIKVDVELKRKKKRPQLKHKSARLHYTQQVSLLFPMRADTLGSTRFLAGAKKKKKGRGKKR